MNKSNENELDDLNQRKDSEESSSSVELGDYSQLLTEDNEPTVSDQSESVGFEEVRDNSNSYVSDEEEGFGVDDSQEENVYKDTVRTSNPNESAPLSRSDNNSKKNSKKNILIVFSILLIIGVAFILVKKPFVNDENEIRGEVVDSTEESNMRNVLKEITSYYEDGASMTKLKAGVTDEKLPEIKKAVDATQADTARKEFNRLYEQLKEDIAAQKNVNSTNYEKVSNSTGS